MRTGVGLRSGPKYILPSLPGSGSRIKDQGSPPFARIRQKTKYRICVIRTVLSSPGSDETNYQMHVMVMVKKGYFVCVDICLVC